MNTSDDIENPTPPESTASDDSAAHEIEFSLEQLSEAYAKVLRGQRELDLPSTLGDADAGDTEVEPNLGAEEILDPVQLDDRRDDAPCRVTESAVLESILFVGTPPDVRLSAKKLAGMMRDISPNEIPGLVAELNERYEQQRAAYRIVREGGSYQMALAEDLTAIRNQFYGEVRAAQLTQQAIDVLAIVAYNQPVTRAQIDRVRQRPSGAILAQLTERQLLAIEPDSESAKQRRYITTDRFLKLFGLNEINDLPQAKEVDNIDEFFG